MRGPQPSKLFLRNAINVNSLQIFWFVSNIFIRKMEKVWARNINSRKGSRATLFGLRSAERRVASRGAFSVLIKSAVFAEKFKFLSAPGHPQKSLR